MVDIGLWEAKYTLEEAFPIIDFKEIYQVDNFLIIEIDGMKDIVRVEIPPQNWWHGHRNITDATIRFYIMLNDKITEATNIKSVPIQNLIYDFKLLKEDNGG